MADFLNRFRAKLESLQAELAPEAGFDRRAYGYDDDPGAEDATFEDLDREEESPWRRPAADDGPPGPAADEPEPARRPGTLRPRASATRSAAAARPEAFDPFGVVHGPSGGGAPRRAPSPPPRGAPAPARTPGAPAAAGVRPAPRDSERGSGSARGARGTGGASRSSRLRARLRQPESLRELFLLREVIDRPVVLRGRRPPPRTHS